MNDFNPAYASSRARSLDMSVDAGLRGFMLGVYNKLGLGLVLTAALAYATSSVAPVRDLMFVTATTPGGQTVATGVTPLGMIVQFLPLVLLFGSMFVMRNPSARGASFLYWAVVASIGASLGLVGLIYTGESIFQVFAITAASFFGLSLWGYTTKRDLTGFGSFLIMGLIGLIVASLIGLFVQSAMLQFVISVGGVLIFAGLIAFDTQRLKLMYAQTAGDTQAMSVATSMGALSLYINVINLFQFLMSLLGQRN